MSRMGEASSRPLPAWVMIAIILLAVCVAMHFAAEDLVFISLQTDLISEVDRSDELTHEDDLVVIANLPTRVSAGDLPAISNALLCAHLRAPYPLLQPPKL